MNLFTIKNALVLGLFFLISSTALAQFTADMVTTEGDVSKTSKFYVENPFYRMDMEEGGQKMFVVVNNETKTTRVFMPSEKMYMEMKSDDMKSLSNDVFQSLEAQGAERRLICNTSSSSRSNCYHSHMTLRFFQLIRDTVLFSSFFS